MTVIIEGFWLNGWGAGTVVPTRNVKINGTFVAKPYMVMSNGIFVAKPTIIL